MPTVNGKLLVCYLKKLLRRNFVSNSAVTIRHQFLFTKIIRANKDTPVSTEICQSTVFLILVQGVGFEPTNLCRIGS